MLFHTWPFVLFLLVFLPVFFALRHTRLWLAWLALGSYAFYAWWNPYFLGLVFYTTTLVYFVTAWMDGCPAPGSPTKSLTLRTRLQWDHPVMRGTFVVTVLGAVSFLGLAWLGPPSTRPIFLGLGLTALLLALGALQGRRGTWLVIGLLTLLAPLFFFKYGRFLEENLNAIFAWLHVPMHLPDPATWMPRGWVYLLPIGISFYTFQSLSYLIDVHLGTVPRERNFLRLANLVCFFPILMAGPIERAGHLLPQFHQFPPIRGQNFTDGLSLLLVGLFKKMALAAYLALYVDRVYDDPAAFGAPTLVLATLAFGWQIYFDFGGYTDMARGVATLLGFDIVLNFNHPYLATSLSDFWRRWHISFSRWILDYIFMPLQMRWRDWRALGTAGALIVTFLVSGIWHGAAWTFIIWGALHGLGLALTFQFERSAFYRQRVPKWLKQTGVFLFVSFTWIFFRANSLADAGLILQRIATAAGPVPQVPALMLLLVALVWVYQFLYETKYREWLKTGSVRISLAVLMLLYLFLNTSGGGTFIYLQF